MPRVTLQQQNEELRAQLAKEDGEHARLQGEVMRLRAILSVLRAALAQAE